MVYLWFSYDASCSAARSKSTTSASANVTAPHGSSVSSGLLVMRSYYFEEKPEEPLREVAQSKYLGISSVFGWEKGVRNSKYR